MRGHWIDPEKDILENRIAFGLLDKNGRQIDAFDIRASDISICFIGDDKHYPLESVPKKKLKLWGVDNFKKLLFHEFNLE